MVRRGFAALMLMAEYIEFGGKTLLKSDWPLFMFTTVEPRRAASAGTEHSDVGSVAVDDSNDRNAFSFRV